MTSLIGGIVRPERVVREKCRWSINRFLKTSILALWWQRKSRPQIRSCDNWGTTTKFSLHTICMKKETSPAEHHRAACAGVRLASDLLTKETDIWPKMQRGDLDCVTLHKQIVRDSDSDVNFRLPQLFHASHQVLCYICYSKQRINYLYHSYFIAY